MESLPLSEFQYSVWKGQKMFPDSPLYNMVFTFDLYGSIDTDRFFESFSQLCQETTSLNLVLDESDEVHPRHRIINCLPQLEYIDATVDASFDLEQWMVSKNAINFDLSKCSYYCALIKQSDNHYVWYFNQHHIFTDAYCFQLAFNRMSEIYSERSKSEGNTKSDEEAYILSCSNANGQIKPQSATNRSAKAPTLSLYGKALTDHSQTESRRFEFGIDDGQRDAINVFLAKKQLKTLASNLDFLAFLMSSLVITLLKVGNEDEATTLSSIFSQRINRKSKLLIKPLLEVLSAEIKWKTTEGYAALHQQIYGFLIRRKGDHEQGTPTLSPVIINFFNLDFGPFDSMEARYIWHHCDHMDSHHSLRFHIFKYQKNGAYTLAFDVKGGEDITTEGQRLVNDFKQVIAETLQEKPANKISLLSPPAMEKLINQVETVNALETQKKDYFVNQFKLIVENNPDAIALYDSGQEVTYQQLLDRSLIVASQLQELTAKTHNTVVIQLPRSQQFIYSVIGSLLQGGSFIPVPNDFPAERVKFILEDVGADVLIHGSQNAVSYNKSIDIDSIDWSSTHSTDSIVGEDCYTLYTSGSTGKPKGVTISHKAFTSYLASAAPLYLDSGSAYHMPLFTSVGFDLTMTSLFLPLYTGGSIHIYRDQEGIDLSIRDVVQDSQLNCFKCTPSHLKLVKGLPVSPSIKSVLIGGENLTSLTAKSLYDQANKSINIYNEYGPTECTVGSIVHRYDPVNDPKYPNVPIGQPMSDCVAFVADQDGLPVPQGVVGELCLISPGLSDGYVNDAPLTNEKYQVDRDLLNARYYRTGDYARVREDGVYEYLGRKDTQIKVRGIRIETGEIENVVESHATIGSCVVTQHQHDNQVETEYIHCAKCGLPSNYPTADFDENDVCGFCRNYETYEKKVEKYFETEERFAQLFAEAKSDESEYDCIMLYSGGKDSTYALGHLVAMGLKVLAFTLDNGYISDNAKENISRIVGALEVDHVFGSTPHMNEIFVDSLKTHCNVCNGCFKTIYNLSLKIAYEKKIPFIVTGLSRGQFFETKLSEEIFWKPMDDVAEIDQTLFAARQAYHGVRDIVYEKTDGAFIEENAVLNSVRILDFYRYHDITLEQLYDYINNKLPWVRPEDTGRSTNCLINKVGIYVHRQERGYSNYAFPYSWDVRTGHKTKEETIDEVEEVITEDDVVDIIKEIGYESETPQDKLVAYYTGEVQSSSDLRAYAAEYLPDYMIPNVFIHVDAIPMTQNGKVDYAQLSQIQYERSAPIKPPSNELEELLLDIWKEVMLLDEISIDDNFFELGGTSLHAIRIVARLEKALDYTLGVQVIFQQDTIESLSDYILTDMQAILESNQN